MKSMDAEELKKTLDVNERMVREKIQQIRTKKGLSMAEFGKLLGCERQFSNMKKGSSRQFL